MTETTIETQGTPILVEFEPMRQYGVHEAARGPGNIPEELAGKSARALDSAMGTIQAMAHRVTETVQDIKIAERPHTVSVEFGLKLDAEVGAYIAKASAEAGFKVTMTWEREPDADA
jgi:hypothetical protein